MGLGNDGPHQWVFDGVDQRCLNCAMAYVNSAVPYGQYSCNNVKVAAETGILGISGDCTRCLVPDGTYRYDPFAREIHDAFKIILVCDDCEREIADDI